MRKLLIALTISLFLMPLVLSASYVVGLVGNASDGTDANGYVITLWNTTAGVTDNRTDTIGVSGGSGTANYFMIDCELLATPCVVGDNVSVQVFDNGSNYTTNISSVLIAGAISNAPYVVLMENATILEGGATLRGVFKLNEGSGNTIYDSLQNLSNGVKSGATWVTDGVLNTLTSGVDYTVDLVTGLLTIINSDYLYEYLFVDYDYNKVFGFHVSILNVIAGFLMIVVLGVGIIYVVKYFKNIKELE